MPAIVRGIVESVAGARKQQPLLVGVLGNPAHIAKFVLRQIAINSLPRVAKIRGLEEEGIAVIDQVAVDAEVGGSRLGVGWFDAGYGSPRRQAGNVLGQIGPVCPAVARIPYQAIIRAGPN